MRRSCYLIGDDLYYLASDGEWLRVREDPQTAMPVELEPRGRQAIPGARIAYDETGLSIDDDDRARELAHQAEVRRLVERYEREPVSYNGARVTRRYASALALDPATACRILDSGALDVAEDSADLFPRPALSVERVERPRYLN